jgi:plasmid stabilization system protein ParE
MAFRVEVLPVAASDIDGMVASVRDRSPNAAAALVAGLGAAMSRISENPRMYAAYAGDPYYRRIPVSGYMVYYHVDEGESAVVVCRVLHGRRNPEGLV